MTALLAEISSPLTAQLVASKSTGLAPLINDCLNLTVSKVAELVCVSPSRVWATAEIVWLPGDKLL